MHPDDAARMLGEMPPEEAAGVLLCPLTNVDPATSAELLSNMQPDKATQVRAVRSGSGHQRRGSGQVTSGGGQVKSPAEGVSSPAEGIRSSHQQRGSSHQRRESGQLISGGGQVNLPAKGIRSTHQQRGSGHQRRGSVHQRRGSGQLTSKGGQVTSGGGQVNSPAKGVSSSAEVVNSPARGDVRICAGAGGADGQRDGQQRQRGPAAHGGGGEAARLFGGDGAHGPRPPSAPARAAEALPPRLPRAHAVTHRAAQRHGGGGPRGPGGHPAVHGAGEAVRDAQAGACACARMTNPDESLSSTLDPRTRSAEFILRMEVVYSAGGAAPAGRGLPRAVQPVASHRPAEARQAGGRQVGQGHRQEHASARPGVLQGGHQGHGAQGGGSYSLVEDSVMSR
eukprot:8377921-Pyramimonas_sp.AAC.1